MRTQAVSVLICLRLNDVNLQILIKPIVRSLKMSVALFIKKNELCEWHSNEQLRSEDSCSASVSLSPLSLLLLYLF